MLDDELNKYNPRNPDNYNKSWGGLASGLPSWRYPIGSPAYNEAERQEKSSASDFETFFSALSLSILLVVAACYGILYGIACITSKFPDRHVIESERVMGMEWRDPQLHELNGQLLELSCKVEIRYGYPQTAKNQLIHERLCKQELEWDAERIALGEKYSDNRVLKRHLLQMYSDQLRCLRRECASLPQADGL